MAVKTVDSRDEGGGHKSFDFIVEVPKEGITNTNVFRKGVQIEKEIFGTESLAIAKATIGVIDS